MLSTAVKFGQAIPKSTVSEKERSYRGEPHTYLMRPEKLLNQCRMGATGIEPMTSTVSR